MRRDGGPLGPWWRERQNDPDGPDFVPGRAAANLTHRDWVQLGTVGTRGRAVVDPRGLVTPYDGGWSFDWWVGAEDRWHLPAREPGVRQTRVDAAPVVETTMRVPGGDAVHRAYAAQGRSGPVVVVEVENRTPVPFAVALAVVPYNPLGDSTIRRIALRGDVVDVDGALVHLPRAPSRVAGGCGDDVLDLVVGGEAITPDECHVVECDAGHAQLALLFPVPHTATLRVVVPMSESMEREPAVVSHVARGDDVARGWRAQLGRGARVVVPDERLQRAFDAARADLLLAPRGEGPAVWPGSPLPMDSATVVVEALDALGFHDEVNELLGGLSDVRGLDGGLASEGGPGANGRTLYALARHWALTRDDQLIEKLIGPVAKAGHWIEKRRTSRRRPWPSGTDYVDLWWSIAGLSGMVVPLTRAGQPEVAQDFDAFATQLRHRVAKAAAIDRERLGSDAPPVRPGAPLAADATINLTAVTITSHDERHALHALAELTRDRWMASGLVVDPEGWGLDPVLTLGLGLVEMLEGDPGAQTRMNAVLDHRSPVDTWPTVIHPRSRGGSRGSGHHLAAAAAFCVFVRTMLVSERTAARPTEGSPAGDEAVHLDLCRLVPPTWLGQSWEVHDLPTPAGRLGYAVRWHGDRPALLWQIDPHPTLGTVQLSAPGLDPGWASAELSGETLFAAVAAPPEGRRDEDGSEASSSFA
jgi:hypothetical protein